MVNRRFVSSGLSTSGIFCGSFEVIDLGGKIQAPERHPEQEPDPSHGAVAIADAHAALGFTRRSTSTCLRWYTGQGENSTRQL